MISGLISGEEDRKSYHDTNIFLSRASVKTMSDMEDAEARMAVVDSLLSQLGLAA